MPRFRGRRCPRRRARRRRHHLVVAELVPVLVLGGTLGVAAATLAIAMFIPLAPAALPRVDSIGISGPVLLFSLAVVALTGLVAGILPAMRGSRAAVPADAPASGVAPRGMIGRGRYGF